jgi:hypothetical protein
MEPDKPDEPRRRGRPPTGKAKTSTQRNEARRERLKTLGGRPISALLTRDEAEALDVLRAGGATVDRAIGDALKRAASLLLRRQKLTGAARSGDAAAP